MLCYCKSSPSFFKVLPFNHTSLKKESCEKDLLVMAIAILALTTLGALLATVSSAFHWWAPFSFTAGASYFPTLGMSIGGGVLMIALTTLLIIRYCRPKTTSSKDSTQSTQQEEPLITPTPTGETHNQTAGSEQTPSGGGQTNSPVKNLVENYDPHGTENKNEQPLSGWTIINPNENEK